MSHCKCSHSGLQLDETWNATPGGSASFFSASRNILTQCHEVGHNHFLQSPYKFDIHSRFWTYNSRWMVPTFRQHYCPPKRRNNSPRHQSSEFRTSKWQRNGECGRQRRTKHSCLNKAKTWHQKDGQPLKQTQELYKRQRKSASCDVSQVGSASWLWLWLSHLSQTASCIWSQQQQRTLWTGVTVRNSLNKQSGLTLPYQLQRYLALKRMKPITAVGSGTIQQQQTWHYLQVAVTCPPAPSAEPHCSAAEILRLIHENNSQFCHFTCLHCSLHAPLFAVSPVCQHVAKKYVISACYMYT